MRESNTFWCPIRNENGGVGLLVVIFTAFFLGASLLLNTARVRQEQKSYLRARSTVGLSNVRNTVLELIDCKTAIQSCETTPENVELRSRAGGNVFASSSDGYQMIDGWKVDVECRADGVSVQAMALDSSRGPVVHLAGVVPSATRADTWTQILRPDELLCQDCSALGIAAPFPIGICREAN